jgi:hypothetical protein
MPGLRSRASYAVFVAILLSGFAFAQGDSIVRATYGEGRRTVDVTGRIQSLVRDGNLNFRLTNEALGVDDPAPGRPKEPRIWVQQWNGRGRDSRFPEKSQVVLQVGRGDSYQGRLSYDEQRRFDSYYSRWLQYQATNRRGEVASMEGRMRDIYRRDQIPLSVDFDEVASPSVRPRR